MSATSDAPRPIDKMTPETLARIREAAIEELAHALAAGVDLDELRPLASLYVRADARLVAIAEAPPPTVERRMELAADKTPLFSRRRARSSTTRTYSRGPAPGTISK